MDIKSKSSNRLPKIALRPAFTGKVVPRDSFTSLQPVGMDSGFELMTNTVTAPNPLTAQVNPVPFIDRPEERNRAQ
jgi:hypothetical protein